MFNLPKREPQTLEQYIAELCLKLSVTPEEVKKAVDIVPCNCCYAGCTGWISQAKKDYK